MNHNYGAHVLQLLKPVNLEPKLCNKRSSTTEPTYYTYYSQPLEPVLRNKGGPLQREAHALQLESGPCSLQLEKTCTQQ